MTTGPENPQPDPTQPYGAQQPDPGAVPPPPPPPPPPPQPAGNIYGQQQQPPPPPPPPAGNIYGQPPPGAPGVYGVSSAAPYGIHPGTGIPYSDKSKVVAGLLQILIPFGVGRFYIGDTQTGVLQLIVAFFTCGLWSIIDGVIMLVKDDTKDSNGYILRS